MGWIRKKLDTLAGTIVAIMSGVSSLQLPAFVNAYSQRLGGHLDEARLGLTAIKTGHVGKVAEEPGLREKLAATAQERVDYLEAAQTAISQAGSFEKPFIFFAHLNGEIASATAEAFTPSFPLDLPSLVLAVLGVVGGLLLWGAVKSPARLIRRRKQRAKEA
jgi:hypothetical protein